LDQTSLTGTHQISHPRPLLTFRPRLSYSDLATMVDGRTTGNPLSAASLSLFMATCLPKGKGPQLKSPTEAIALAVNAGMTAVGFRLIGLGEDEKIGTTFA